MLPANSIIVVLDNNRFTNRFDNPAYGRKSKILTQFGVINAEIWRIQNATVALDRYVVLKQLFKERRADKEQIERLKSEVQNLLKR